MAAPKGNQYAVGNKGGGSKYKPEYVEMLYEHFDIEAGVDVEVENSKGVLQSVRHAADFPTFASFACLIGVDRSTILLWSQAIDAETGKLKHKEFSKAYKIAKDHQERILIQNGLKGGYQANFAIFTAKNVLGWRDKKDVDVSSTDGTMTPPPTKIRLVDGDVS